MVEAWLRADLRIKGTVVHERLVAEYGFTGHYQRVKMFLGEARPRIATELADRDENPLRGLLRRFEVVPGAQAQVDWGDEGDLLAHVGIPTVYSFHMVLSHSGDPCCFITKMDLATFWDCHRRAFAHFGGVPGAIVYDRTKTVIRRHVAPGIAAPLHPEAAAFADHYGFTIDVLAAYRPTRKGRVERQVNIARDHVLAGRSFDSIAGLDGALTGWLPIRRRQVHRTHSQVIAVRAETDRAALAPLPEQPYLVGEKHLRRVGKDCLISFQASCYSVPARLVRPGQWVQLELHIGPAGEDQISIHALAADGGAWLTSHHKSTRRDGSVIDPAHWAGLPDGHTRAVTLEPSKPSPTPQVSPTEPLSALLVRRHADLRVAARPLAEYAHAASVTGPPQVHTMTRQNRGFTHVHPPGLSLTRGLRMEQGPFGLNPALASRVTHDARQGGNRPQSTDLSYVTAITASHQRSYLRCETSCRTEGFIPFLEFPPEVRKINDDAVVKLLWLAIRYIEDKRARERAKTGWPAQK